MKGVILDRGSIEASIDLSPLTSLDIDWDIRNYTKEEDLEKIQGADILITNKVPISQGYLQKNTGIKLICVLATGYNVVDIATAESLGIPVCNARHYCTESVAQHTCALILALARSLVEYDRSVYEGRWAKSDFFCYFDFPIRQVNDDTILIVGRGALGRAVGKATSAFGMQAQFVDSKTSPEKMDTLIASADWISLHCPSNKQTKSMIDAGFLSKMKPTAYLINTARGDLVVEEDLLKALHEKQIAGAALDVLRQEPPQVPNTLLRNKPKNLIITPHIAWASRKAQQQVIAETRQNLVAFLQGETRNCVYGSQAKN